MSASPDDFGDGQHGIDLHAKINMSGRNTPYQQMNEFRVISEVFSVPNPIYDRYNAALPMRPEALSSRVPEGRFSYGNHSPLRFFLRVIPGSTDGGFAAGKFLRLHATRARHV